MLSEFIFPQLVQDGGVAILGERCLSDAEFDAPYGPPLRELGAVARFQVFDGDGEGIGNFLIRAAAFGHGFQRGIIIIRRRAYGAVIRRGMLNIFARPGFGGPMYLKLAVLRVLLWELSR